MHSGCEEAVPHRGEVVHGLEKICIKRSGYSLHFLAKSPTSFSNFYMTCNSPKIKKAFLQYKRFGKTVDYSNWEAEREGVWHPVGHTLCAYVDHTDRVTTVAQLSTTRLPCKDSTSGAPCLWAPHGGAPADRPEWITLA